MECGGTITKSWECLYGVTGSFAQPDLPAARPEIMADIGADCRCGCIVHLTMAKPRRIIAATAQSCPGRTFWLLQCDDNHRIQLVFDFFRLICSTQYVRIRNGDSLAAELLAELSGGSAKNSEPIISSGNRLLLEFYSNELSMMKHSCKGGFLTHAQQIRRFNLGLGLGINDESRCISFFFLSLEGTISSDVELPQTIKAVQSTIIAPAKSRLKTIHVVAILFIGVIIMVSALLGVQYVFRYRKYQLTASAGESDSPANTPRASIGSIAAGHLDSRAVSTSTLISEVISMVKIRPRGQWTRHSRLRESIDGDALVHAISNIKSNR